MAVTVKKVQYGSTTLSAGSASTTASINSVTPGNTFVHGTVAVTSASPNHGQISTYLTNGTTITFTRNNASGSPAAVIDWFVVEFDSGASVQRGSATWSDDTQPLAVTLSPAITLSKAFPIISYDQNGTLYNRDDFVAADFSSTTQLDLQTNDPTPYGTGPSDGPISWQVVSLDNVTAQHGQVSWSGSTITQSVTVSTYDTTQTFLPITYRIDNGGSADIGQKMIRAVITDSTHIDFDRDHAGSTTAAAVIEWHLVEFTDLTVVQKGEDFFDGGGPTVSKDITVSSTHPDRSFVWMSGLYGYGGQTPFNTDDNPSPAQARASLTSSTNLHLERAGGGSVDGTIAWFVIRIATTKEQTGVSRITASTTKSLNGVSRITASTTKSLNGVSRITASTTKSLTGISNIASGTVHTDKDLTGVSRITATTTQDRQGTSRIQVTTTKDLSGVSRITATTTQDRTGVSRIQVSTTQDRTGVSRITATTTKSLNGVSRITATTTKSLTGISKIAASSFPVLASTLNGTNGGNNTTTDIGIASLSSTTGDLLMVFVTIDGTGSITWPGGWTQTPGFPKTLADANIDSRYKESGASESDIQLTHEAQRTNWISAKVTNWDTAEPPDAGTASNGTSTSPDPPSVTAGWGSADNLFIAVTGHDDGSVATTGAPTNYTGLVNQNDTNGPHGTGIAIAYRQLTASSDDPGTFTNDASSDWGAQTIVLRPSAGTTHTDKDLTGTSRITATTTKSLTGVSSIKATTTQDRTGVSRIQVATTQDRTGVSRITATTTQDRTGVSRITATTTQDRTGVSRIQVSTTQDRTGVSRIQTTSTQDRTGTSRITATSTQDRAGTSRITATTVRNQTGISNISVAGHTDQPQTGISRITASTTQSRTGVSRIETTSAQTRQGISRIQVATVQDRQGISRVTATTTQTRDGLSRITTTTTQTQDGVGRIQSTSTQTQDGVARIEITSTQSLQGISTITATVTQDQLGISSIFGSTVQNQTGSSWIAPVGFIDATPGRTIKEYNIDRNIVELNTNRTIVEYNTDRTIKAFRRE